MFRPSPNIRGNRPAPRRAADMGRKPVNSRSNDSRSKRAGPSYGGVDRGADRGAKGTSGDRSRPSGGKNEKVGTGPWHNCLLLHRHNRTTKIERILLLDLFRNLTLRQKTVRSVLTRQATTRIWWRTLSEILCKKIPTCIGTAHNTCKLCFGNYLRVFPEICSVF